jgi:hypothetical protein
MRELLRDGAPDAAEKPGESMGAQAGGALALRLLARAPAALETDEQADRQREAQSLDQLGGAHFIHARKLPKTPTMALAPKGALI